MGSLNLRRWLVLGLCAASCAAPGCHPRRAVSAATGVHDAGAAAPSSPASRSPELPGGGRTLFPSHLLVGFCGTPGAPALGELTGNLAVKSKALLAYTAKYAGGERKVLPVFELIAVVVQAGAGADGKYRRRVDDATVDAYLRVAREGGGLLLLNLQPGQSDFLAEAKHFEKYLREPDVGVALDPEWEMRAGQKPGRVYGQTTGAEINGVAELLAKLVADGGLPEKALVFHQVTRSVVKDEASLRAFPGVVLIKSVDGLGPKQAKLETYANLMEVMAPAAHPGFKLFFDEDRRNGGVLMTPAEVMSLKPRPEYVMVE